MESYVKKREALKASKREADPKMSCPIWMRPDQDPRKTTWLIDGKWTRCKAWSGPALMIVRLVSLHRTKT